MKLCLPVILIFLSSVASASVKDVYIGQVSIGANSGADCANAHAVGFFNMPGNWGAGVAQIGQDTTVHLCGIISTSLHFYGSGASGHPITLLWEPEAKISEPYCAAACINTAGYAYLVLDGGTNGIIENTANGSMLANHSNSFAVTAPGCTGCEFKKLRIQNIYVHTPSQSLVSVVGNGSTATGTCAATCAFSSGVKARIYGNSVSQFNGDFTVLTASGSKFTFASAQSGTGTGGTIGDVTIDNSGARGIDIGGNNWLVHDNLLHDMSWALWNDYGSGSDTGGKIYNNEIFNIDHGIIVVGSGPHDVGPFYIFNNHLHDFQNWDDPTGHWHHDGIHAYTSSSGGFPNVTELWIYNNLFDGDVGDVMTAFLFLEGNTASPWTRSVANGGTGRAIVFNNVFIGTPGRLVNGYVQVGNSNRSQVYNNTILCANTAQCFIANNGPNYKFKNNIISGSSNVLVDFDGTTSFAELADLDNNLYLNCTSPGHNCFVWHGSVWTNNFDTFRAATLGDADSTANLTSTGNIGVDGKLLIGSPAIGRGANLTSVGITDLNSDRLGAPRPPSGAWAVGAYNPPGSSLPRPPSGLTVVVR